MNQILQKPIGSPDQESTDGLPVDDIALERITKLYVEQLAVPSERPERQFLLCPIGLVGAGKSTVIKPLVERLHLVRVSTDEIRKLLKEQGYNHIRTSEIAYSIISDFARNGHSIAIDADCAGNNVADTITQSAKTIGAKVVWIHINPPEAFIINKLKNFQHTWLFKDADEAIANYYRRKPLHEHLDYPFIYTFDPSRPDLPKQLNEAVKLIEAFLKE